MMVLSPEGLLVSYNNRDSLKKAGVYDGVIFHLYPVEDYDFDSTELGLAA
jgi:hypothetical protein